MSASSTSAAEEDLEAPLPTELRQKQEDAFLAKYSLKFPPELQPSSSLFARHYREFRRMKKEVDDLQKVRSAAESSALPATEVKQLGDFRVILKAEYQSAACARNPVEQLCACRHSGARFQVASRHQGQ